MQLGLLFFLTSTKIRMLPDFSKNLENWPSGAAVTREQTGMMKLVAAFCTCSVNMAKESTFWEQLYQCMKRHLPT
jgi:hypothetical protein